jgi:hypothetical protein
VYWPENATAEQVQKRMQPSTTTLTSYFENNSAHPSESAILYEHFLECHVWTGKNWKLWEQQFSIGRLYHAHSIQGECFYLQMFLTVKLGPKLFEDLHTVNVVEHSIF